jgi:hypothetical protein
MAASQSARTLLIRLHHGRWLRYADVHEMLNASVAGGCHGFASCDQIDAAEFRRLGGARMGHTY